MTDFQTCEALPARTLTASDSPAFLLVPDPRGDRACEVNIFIPSSTIIHQPAVAVYIKFDDWQRAYSFSR